MDKGEKAQKKGLSFEYKIMSLFQKQGYLTRRSIPLLNTDNQDATDIDILGIKFIHPFIESKIICDCKNKKSPKPFERIFWTKGLSEFIGVDDVFVALPKVSEDIIKFANKGNIKIFTEDIINSYISSDHLPQGLADETFYSERFMCLDKASKEYKEIGKFFIEVKPLYNYKNAYTGFNKAIFMLQECSKKIIYYKSTNADINLIFSWEYLSYELITVLAVLFLRMCSDNLVFPKSVREDHIRTKLTYGDLEPRKANDIIRIFNSLSNQMIKRTLEINKINYFEPLKIDKIETPAYASGVVNLVEMMLLNPNYYIELPQVLSFLLFEYALKKKTVTVDEFEIEFGKSNSKEKIKASKNIFAFVKTYCNIDVNDIWIKSEAVEIKTT